MLPQRDPPERVSPYERGRGKRVEGEESQLFCHLYSLTRTTPTQLDARARPTSQLAVLVVDAKHSADAVRTPTQPDLRKIKLEGRADRSQEGRSHSQHARQAAYDPGAVGRPVRLA